jgi:hypothetical protein
MRALTFMLLAGLAVAPAAARAAVTEANFHLETASDLAAVCSAEPDDKLYTAARNFCHGFMVGTYRVLIKEEAAGGVKTICLPDPAPSRDGIVTAYVAFAGARPAAGAAPAEDSVLQFLQLQYPCAATKPAK